MSAHTLTPKQERVRSLMEDEGLNARQVAKKMKISPNAVYAHIRALRMKGQLGTVGTDSSQETTANGNGSSSDALDQIAKTLKQAEGLGAARLDQIRQRVLALEEQRDAIHMELEALGKEQAQIRETLDRFVDQPLPF